MPDETTRLLPDEYTTPITEGPKTSASVSNVDADRLFPTTSLFDTNYNFDPNAVGASAPAGVTGSVHGMSLHQFFFPRYNPTIQRYYRFTTSPDTPFAALHKRPGNGGAGAGAGAGGTSTCSTGNTGSAVNNSGVTGLLRRSAGEYYDTCISPSYFMQSSGTRTRPSALVVSTSAYASSIHSFFLSYIYWQPSLFRSLLSPTLSWNRCLRRMDSGQRRRAKRVGAEEVLPRGQHM